MGGGDPDCYVEGHSGLPRCLCPAGCQSSDRRAPCPTAGRWTV